VPNTSITGTYTFTVTAIDNAGNVTTSSVSYTVNALAPAADVAIVGEMSDHPEHGTNLIYSPWVLDLS
jgi:hypothetical protein